MGPRALNCAVLFFFYFAAASAIGCSVPHKGIVYSDSADWFVTNGTAYDVSVLKLDGVKKVIVPASARLESGLAGSDYVIQMIKTQGFMGHPGERVSIVHTRKEMGCAILRKDDSAMLGTFGEWDSNIEGGNSIKLSIIVPAGIEIATQEDLSGPKSLARKGVKEGDWEKLPFTPADKTTMAEMQRREE